jgi:hypothetical protein
MDTTEGDAWWAMQRKTGPVRALMLQWPLLIVTWGFALLFIWSINDLRGEDIVHEETSTIDRRWLVALLPSMYVPLMVVFAYWNWLGWQFFRHN